MEKRYTQKKKLHKKENILKDDYMGKRLYDEQLYKKKMIWEIKLHGKRMI